MTKTMLQISAAPVRLDFAWWVRVTILAVAGTVIAIGVVGTLRANHYTAAQWFDLFAFGLTLGGVYALLALGYSMVYGVLRLINFAHGDIMMVGVFAAFFVARYLQSHALIDTYPALSIIGITATGAAVSALTALGVERIAYRPLRHVKGSAPLITSIGMSFLLQQCCRGMFGSSVKAYPDAAWLQSKVTLGTLAIPAVEVLALGAAVLTMLALYLIIHGTRIGTAMRATAEDPRAAMLMGININRVVVFTFLLGGLSAGIGGVLYALIYKQVYFMMGFLPGVKAFGAAVLGGIGSVPGAMIGGIILGLAENIGPTLVLEGLGIPAPYQLRDLISFALLIGILICRPQGLLGERNARQRA